MKEDVLTQISKSVSLRLNLRKKIVSFDDLKKKFPLSRKPHDFMTALAVHGTNIIAELKSQSPSEGKLRAEFPLLEIASQYVKNGARALSVLTEEDHFDGHLRNLELVRKDFPKIPLLMKDFILDEYQIYEGALLGADAILLIVALLKEADLIHFSKVAQSLGLTCLVEVHNRFELEVALKHNFSLIGVNNRNLKTLEVSLETARELSPLVGDSVILVCESGLKTSDEIIEMKKLGFDAFLIGSALMKSESPGKKLAEIIEQSR